MLLCEVREYLILIIIIVIQNGIVCLRIHILYSLENKLRSGWSFHSESTWANSEKCCILEVNSEQVDGAAGGHIEEKWAASVSLNAYSSTPPVYVMTNSHTLITEWKEWLAIETEMLFWSCICNFQLLLVMTCHIPIKHLFSSWISRTALCRWILSYGNSTLLQSS